jgi:hypothetical protein
MKSCPACLGAIQDEAVKCRHCKTPLTTSNQSVSATNPVRGSLGTSWGFGPTPRAKPVLGEPVDAGTAPLAEGSMPVPVSPPQLPPEIATSGETLTKPGNSSEVHGWRKFFALAGVVFALPFFVTNAGWDAHGTYKKWKAGNRGQPNGLIFWGVFASLLFALALVSAFRDSSTLLIVTITGLTLIHLLAVAMLLFYTGAGIPLVGRFAGLAALALVFYGVQAAYRFSYEKFAEYVRIEAAWQEPPPSPAYAAKIYNHMGEKMTFRCTVNAIPRGTDTFTAGPLDDGEGTTVTGELRVANGQEVYVERQLHAECSAI